MDRGEEMLNQFLIYLNTAHRTIKFMLKWSREQIDFFDVRVANELGESERDVCETKQITTNTYIIASVHYTGCKVNIP